MRALGLCACLLMACASAPVPTTSVAKSPPVTLTLARPDSTLFALGTYHAGKPLLLFLFATYDTASQAALAQLERFLATDANIDALGLALQPDARSFLGIYRDALNVDFPLAYDPEDAVLQGKSELGRIQTVPAFVVLDGERRVRAIRYGVAMEAELRQLVDEALER